LDFGKCQ